MQLDPAVWPLPFEPSELTGLLSRRRSTRGFATTGLTARRLGHVLWCAYGRHPGGRTVPSAHALHRLEIIVTAGGLDGPDGAGPATYRYRPDGHALDVLAAGDRRAEVADASLEDGGWLRDAAALLVVAADLPELAAHFAGQPDPDERARRYAFTELGHLSQNAYLAAAELGLGCVLVGGVDDGRLRRFAATVTTGVPLAILATGPATG